METGRNLKMWLVMSVFLLAMVPTATAGIIYVDVDADGANDGTSWGDAYYYLQDALADADSNPDLNEIWVAQGTYTPDTNSADPCGTGNRKATFQLISGVGIYGGFPSGGGAWSDRDPNAYETILSGDLNNNDAQLTDPADMWSGPRRYDNSEHVVTGSGTDANAVLDGFTITAGYNGGLGGGMLNQDGSPTVTNCTFTWSKAEFGGGIGNHNSSPKIINCKFERNAAKGGGMSNENNSHPIVINCTFSNNSGFFAGGGMYNARSSPTIANCTFNNNSARTGGGICSWDSSPTITNCIISGNLAKYEGGGIYCTEGSGLLSNSKIIENSAFAGGGIGFYNMSETTIVNCIINRNQAQWGGGIYGHSNGAINNCTINDNLAERDGGIARGGPIINSTITGNSAEVSGGGIRDSDSISNCVIWNNFAPRHPQLRSHHLYPNYSCIQDWTGGGTANITSDPCFVEPGYWADVNDPNVVVEPNDPNAIWVEGDYHLLKDSPCIDAGDPNYVAGPNETDLDGNPRVVDGDNDGNSVVDMGAYELVPVEVKMQLTPQTLNCSGKGKWVKAHITIAEGFYPEDVDVNEPAIAYPMEAESEYITVLGGDKGPVRLEVVFGREAFCDSIIDDYLDVTVIGSLTTGEYFQGTDTIKVTNKSGKSK